MKATLLTPFLVAAALLALGAGIRDVHKQTTAIVEVKPVAAPSMAPVMLPTILVVPTTQERAEALLDKVADQYSRLLSSADLVYGDSESGDGSMLTPRMNFDMPYYSFGKVLPRVSRK